MVSGVIRPSPRATAAQGLYDGVGMVGDMAQEGGTYEQILEEGIRAAVQRKEHFDKYRTHNPVITSPDSIFDQVLPEGELPVFMLPPAYNPYGLPITAPPIDRAGSKPKPE